VRKALLFVAVGLLGVRQAGAQTEVRRAGDRLDVRATTSPLSEVLDRLARETGMKVSYDGPPPRGRISVALSGVSSLQAVMSVLEGQGLNYALRMDPSGARVDTLMIVGGTATASAGPAPMARGPRAVPRDEEATADDEDTPPAEVSREEPQEQPRRAPFPGGMPGGLPGGLPGGFPAGLPNGPAMPLALPTPGPPAAPPATTPSAPQS